MKKGLPAVKRGFTLIEILISIAIIAVLTALGIVSYVSINKNTRDAKRRGDVEQLRSALELYRSDNGSYPAVSSTGWVDVSNLTTSLVDTYLPSIPSDPKGNPYMYRTPSSATAPVYSYCLAAFIEGTTSNTCAVDLPTNPTNYTYGTKNP